LKKYLGTRIGAVDFGMKRIGTAISDELHVTTRPLYGFINKENVIDEISDAFHENNVRVLVVGLPLDDEISNKKNNSFELNKVSKRTEQKNELIQNIKEFSEKLKGNGFEIYHTDEGFSSQKAKELMIDSGKKKKFRKEKLNTDNFAAAIILQEFLEQNK
jgi:putative pre-16S rRNA nuclease